MYSLNIPVSAIRTKIRQQFERHRYVNQLKVVDVLLAQSHAEYQVRLLVHCFWGGMGYLSINVSRAWLGNSELLEAAFPCDEVFPARGGSKGSAAAEFHFRVLGGEISVLGLKETLY